MKTTDVELIHRVLDGDDTAFTVLVKKYQKPIHALVWRKIGDFHIAEEITQDTFLKAYQELATLKKPQSFSSWLYVIAANNCSTWLRKKRLRTEPLEDARLQKATYSGYVVAENERVTAEAQREAVKKLLAKLQESERTVITLHYFGEMSSAEIGAFLGVSANTVRSRLRRAQQRLKREEPMIREALENFQITPNFTENIMREIARLKPTAPSGGKPFIPWVIGVSAVAIVLLMFGLSNQSLLRFQKPYSFNAASMKVELIDAPVVLNLEVEPDNRTQLGNANAQDKNNGVGNQVDAAASLGLETLITKMKHSDNAVTSVTGNFVMERHQDQGIGKNEYRLMFEGQKVQMEQEEGWPIIGYWDGDRSWEGAKNKRMIFEFEIAPGKEKTDLEAIRQAFKHNAIDLANDVRIVDGDEPESFTLVENETGTEYFFWLEGETTLLVYDYHLEYSVRPQWLIPSSYDPRFWLTFPSLGSNNSYLSEPLWQLLEKHESEIIGSEILNGEKTSVIRLNIPAWSTEDFKMPAKSYKLWISHDKGFRLVKSEQAFTVENPTEWSSYKAGVTYISTRKIEYHEYLPDVWFPERIESITVPKASSEQQQDEADFVYKNVLLTKACRINTDVTGFLSLRLPPDTPVFDYGEGQQSFVENVLNPKPKPDILTQYESDVQVYDPAPHDLQTVIAEMKRYDSAIVSASGDFVIEHHRDTGIAKTQYALTFEGKKIRVEQKRDFPMLDKDVPLIKRLLPLVKIYDGAQQWEIYKYKKLLFSLEVTPDKATPILETIRQAFKQQGTKLADDVRIVASEQPDSYTLIENQTGKSYFILWEADTTLKVYDLHHLEYGVWYQRNILSDLDPRYWLTYPGEGETAYLTEPLWQLLEKHESKLLGSELLNGEETSVIRLNLPKQSLKLWISHNKGFRLVQLDSAFIAKRPVASMQFQVGNIYVETRKIDHHEYLPDVWFPKKIERYYTPLTDADPQGKDQVILKRTVVHTQQCRLNTDVAALLRLDLPPDTPVLGLKPESDAPKAEKIAFLRQEIPRTLNLRLDMLKLVEELAEFHAKDPDLSLPRDQAYEKSRKLIWIISNLGHRHNRLTNDDSAFKSGGEFHDLMKQNGIGISRE